MKIKSLSFVSCLLSLCIGSANANWQYPGDYPTYGVTIDDGSRFTMSARGGASWVRGDIKNEIGTMTESYFMDEFFNVIPSVDCASTGCAGLEFLGVADFADIPARTDLSEISFAFGASIGWTIPNSPQWRLEFGWDHISKTDYNSTPMFDGDVTLTGGDYTDVVLNIPIAGVQSSIETDVFSVMAFYDFYEGVAKPMREVIPYIGLGFGYADSATVLNLSDLTGELSPDLDFQKYGEMNEFGIVEFYPSKQSSGNFAGVLALGFSYGLADNMFIDLGARVTYIPRVKWQLTNVDDTRQRDFFSAENMIYANVMLGIRFEF